MTRRGSLAYYSSGVSLGAFFLATTYYFYSFFPRASHEHWARDYLVVYFFTMMLSFAPLLFLAFVLRRLAASFHWSKPWPWLVVGTVQFLALLWGFAQLGAALDTTRGVVGWWRLTLTFALLGPMMAVRENFWLAALPAALTAFTLYRVDRTFAAE